MDLANTTVPPNANSNVAWNLCNNMPTNAGSNN